jgi:murein tripeptide amidase MpaA
MCSTSQASKNTIPAKKSFYKCLKKSSSALFFGWLGSFGLVDCRLEFLSACFEMLLEYWSSPRHFIFLIGDIQTKQIHPIPSHPIPFFLFLLLLGSFQNKKSRSDTVAKLTLALVSLLAGMIKVKVNVANGCEDLWETSPETLQSLLPPSLPWNDTMSVQDFVANATDVHVTPAEASNFTETATYQEVTEFFTKLAAESPYVELESIATLANGEELLMVTVSGEEQKFATNDTTKPILLATAGIHAGESSGVNAGMMLIRNMVMDPAYEELLNSVNFLLIPVLNVQGYLRQSITGRINQYGPNTSGRRVNASWKNLNRDFGKLDTLEIQAVVKVMDKYDLSFYTDLHSTDGMNYQPDVTWCDNGNAGLSNEIYKWMRSEMQPDLEAFVEGYSHVTSVCYSANDRMDPTAGYYPYFSGGTEYSVDYADHRQIPAYLLEIHSLKPNKQRVLGAYAFLQGLLTIVGEKADTLRMAIDADRAVRVGK